MTEASTTTITAAQAAQDADLWKRVERGEARVTREWYGRNPSVAYLYTNHDALHTLLGDFDWQHDGDSGYEIAADELLTITAIPVADQSRSSPAAIERAEADADVLRAVVNELRSTNERLTGIVETLRGYINQCDEKFGKDAMPYDPEDTGLFAALGEGGEDDER